MSLSAGTSLAALTTLSRGTLGPPHRDLPAMTSPPIPPALPWVSVHARTA